MTSAFESIAGSAGRAAIDMITEAMTFWAGASAVDPDGDGVPRLQFCTLPIAALVLVGSVLAQTGRTVPARRRDPSVNVWVGLTRSAMAAAVALALLGASLRAADLLADVLVGPGVGQYPALMGHAFTGIATTNPFTLLLTGLLAVLLAALQWLFGVVRQAGILALAATVSSAAGWAVDGSTRARRLLHRTVPWLITLIGYKPVAAAVYAAGTPLMATGPELRTVLTGSVVMALAVLVMPAMLHFVTYAQRCVVDGPGAGGVVAAGATGAVPVAVGAWRGSAIRSARTVAVYPPAPAPAQAVQTGGVARGPVGSSDVGAPAGRVPEVPATRSGAPGYAPCGGRS